MTRDEFFEWLNIHDAAFPGFHGWWCDASEEVLQARLQFWLGRIGQFTVPQLKQITEQMFSATDKPKFHSEHLDWMCAKLRPRPLLNSTQQTSAPKKCRLCNDSGMVTVIFQEQRFTPGGCPLPDNTGVAACKCQVGQWLNERRSKSPGGTQLETLDLQRMDIPQPLQLSAQERREIEERVKSRHSGLAMVLQRFMQRTKASSENDYSNF